MRSDRYDLELSESEKEELEKMEREAEATRKKLSQQEREIELRLQDLKEKRLEQERARERERVQSKTAEATEWLDQTEPWIETLPDDLLEEQLEDSFAEVQPEPSSDELDDLEEEDELEEDELEEENAKPETQVTATTESKKPGRIPTAKGQLVSDEQACERCRARRQSCHKQDNPGRVICYECSKGRTHCSWSVKPRTQRSVKKTTDASKTAGPSKRTDGGTLSAPSTPSTLDLGRLEDRLASLKVSLTKEPGPVLNPKVSARVLFHAQVILTDAGVRSSRSGRRRRLTARKRGKEERGKNEGRTREAGHGRPWQWS
ncbi:hypothetical protein FB45DRAFT_457540 [Roridomyces roridus]|uniref:Zn(2)-C6 fungal-type domain-containing protein n=1 Tax=Roridomyces roridus TaxID=1738132 RepID=A0AAD7C2K9_9AGAR|nr:hypothetical protein FB45DRAFT_457540 [Roridomyces roridus]